MLYDLTTLHFETPKEDALRKVRISKERRVDREDVPCSVDLRWRPGEHQATLTS